MFQDLQGAASRDDGDASADDITDEADDTANDTADDADEDDNTGDDGDSIDAADGLLVSVAAIRCYAECLHAAISRFTCFRTCHRRQYRCVPDTPPSLAPPPTLPAQPLPVEGDLYRF